jgi:SAM-dependent MidA family methyltransferase
LNHLFQLIAAEIAAHRVISFKRFMELALYCPDYGYYEKEKDNIGRTGDFYTSVSVGNLFGQLLGARFATWLDELNQPSPNGDNLILVEAGAHHGHLALDILTWFRQFRPDLLCTLQYLILEPSSQRQEIQARRLAEFSPHLAWASSLNPGTVRGIIFSNELLDAMPLTRVQWDAAEQAWRELGVTLHGAEFRWERMPGSISVPWPVPPALLAALPDGFMTEFSNAAAAWWQIAAKALISGRLLTLDYGFQWMDFLHPARGQGTLRAYRQHRVSADPLLAPGEQDLTAHVDFSELQRRGEEAGLTTERFERQGAFLGGIVRELTERQTPFPDWTPPQFRQLQTLTHPESLGDRFQVLVQRRA